MTLMLHCGAEPINRNELFQMGTPKGMTDTHYPIAHRDLVEMVEHWFNRFGKYEITNQEFGISHDQNRMFGLMSLRGANAKSNWETIIAYPILTIRHSAQEWQVVHVYLYVTILLSTGTWCSGESTPKIS